MENKSYSDEVVAEWWQTISPVGVIVIHNNLQRESYLARHPHSLHHQFSTVAPCLEFLLYL